MGYDTNPAFSPNGKYVAWQSMARDGYESDRNRLCILELATGKKSYVTESLIPMWMISAGTLTHAHYII